MKKQILAYFKRLIKREATYMPLTFIGLLGILQYLVAIQLLTFHLQIGGLKHLFLHLLLLLHVPLYLMIVIEQFIS